MRSGYIVSYDVCDPKRLRKILKTMRGFGDHIQLSVFRCELSEVEKARMIAKVDRLLHHVEDQVLIIDMGPAPGRSDDCVRSLGRAYVPKTREAVIV